MKNKTKNNCSIIGFSENSIKILQCLVSRKGIIAKAYWRDIEKDIDEAKLTEELQNLINAHHLKISNLVVCLERNLVTLRCVKLPSTNEEEIGRMARWQAAKILPYKAEEIVSSHRIIGINNQGSSIVLAIASQDILRKFNKVCSSLRLQPKVFTISSEGLLYWCINHQPFSSQQNVLLIDLDQNRAELVIICKNNFVFSRVFILKQIKDNIEITNKVIKEINLTLDYYRKQETYQKVDKIILTGPGESFEFLSSALKKEFDLPLEIIGHLEKLKLAKEIQIVGQKNKLSFACLCGLALSKELPKIDLRPPEIKQSIIYLEKKAQLFKMFISFIFATLILTGVFIFNFKSKMKIVSDLDKKIEKIKPAAEKVQDIKNKINLINIQLSQRSSCLEILKELYSITPENIYLTSFIFEDNGFISLKGTASTMSLVFNFVSTLNKSAFFKNVQVKYATQRKSKKEQLTDFRIVCEIVKK